MVRPLLISLALTTPAAALEIEQCTRTTHVSHGGEAWHRDLGQKRVAWIEWWSQEGTYSDLYVADCAEHRVLVSRLSEDRIKDRQFDRREAGREVFERHLKRAPALFSLDDLAQDLTRISDDTRLVQQTAETCACAAAYPETRGALDPFALN